MTLAILAVLCLASAWTQEPPTRKLGELPGISHPHSLHIVGDNLVFLDGFTVHVYSLDPLQPRYAFGAKVLAPISSSTGPGWSCMVTRSSGSTT